jgi:energy-coupling factor transporter ATP-binding protein EcfA2
MATIDIYPPSKKTLKELEHRFALQQDDWNDYSFQTLYHLHYRHGKESNEVTYIGGVKILKKGQTRADYIQITEKFSTLGDEFASVGTSLDYYQRLNEIPPGHRSAIMRAIRDVVAHPDLVDEFSKEEGWKTSLFRDNSQWEEFIQDAKILYEGNFAALADMKEAFSYLPKGSSEAIEFDFSSPAPEFYGGPYRRLGPSNKKTLLPDRVIVLIGRNGSGKSTILSLLARVAFASPQERATKEIKSLGQLKPNGIGFMRVITVSYSAFDSFIVPGTDAKELSQLTSDIENGEGRFIFCGLRDIVAEVRDDVELAESTMITDEADLEVERRTSTRLKSLDSLADEFAKLILKIKKDEKTDLFQAALNVLLEEASFTDLKSQEEELYGTPAKAKKLFLSWSTGHKIALHVVASLVAHARPRSLVLFDEPEVHLHPPLMAALMQAVRLVLTEVNAFCIVATHSPVLLQETLARHVRYVRRVGNSVSVKQPLLETFGENIGALTYHSFGLTASSTDYHHALDLLVKSEEELDDIEKLFTPGLSSQARAYIISKLAARDEKK